MLEIEELVLAKEIIDIRQVGLQKLRSELGKQKELDELEERI